MNKIWKILISLMLVVVSCLCFVACDGDDGNDVPDGYVFKTYGDDGYYTLVSYKGTDATLTVPAEYEGKKVGRIKANAFSGNSTIETLIIPDSVEVIDKSAFGGMIALKELTVPFVGQYADSETSINDNNVTGENKAVDEARTFGYVFSSVQYDGSLKLTQTYNDATETDDDGNETATGVFDFYMPAKLKTVNIIPAEGYGIPAYAFYGNQALYKVTLGEKVNAIGDYAFYSCQVLNTFTVTAGVKKIGDYALYGCRALGNENNGKGFAFATNCALEDIGDYAFCGIKTTSLVLPGSVKNIGKYAFASITSANEILDNGETQLKTITLSENLKSIGEGAFFKCVKLETVTIPAAANGITVGSYAFEYCERLVSFDSSSERVIDLSKTNTVGTMAFAFLGEAEYEVIEGGSNVNAYAFKDTKTK